MIMFHIFLHQEQEGTAATAAVCGQQPFQFYVSYYAARKGFEFQCTRMTISEKKIILQKKFSNLKMFAMVEK